ncbi:Transmembrane protein 62 [Podochytrium sp. JEL0797]|nr:Transmembrane protein 62 [Podochytrium sp. JEL0797]
MNRFILPILTLLAWLYAFHLNNNARSSLVPTHPHGFSTDADPDPSRPDDLVIRDDPTNLFTFIQISDIHISRHNPTGGIPHFASFLSTELPTIAPDLCFLSGDLVDAKTPSKLISEQYRDEWVAYRALIEASGVEERNGGEFYFDQRGNHDCFNIGVPFEESEYATMSASKHEGYTHHHHKPFGTYSFTALDACPTAGMSRPVNFFGTLDSNDMNQLASVIDATQELHGNHTFISTHYPTSTMVLGRASDGRSFGDLSKGVSMWVSGHLHKLIGGVIMYGYHSSSDLLELQLGDMKDNAVWRLVAVDNDFISVTDEILALPSVPAPVEWDIKDAKPPFPMPGYNRHPRPPVILVTVPRDARFATPTHEPIKRILTSTHIRVLIYGFSGEEGPDAGVIDARNVTFKIDGVKVPEPVEYKGSGAAWSDIQNLEESVNRVPLYVSKWDPRVYNDGRDHWLEVEAIDSAGRTAVKKIAFRVDGERARSHGMESGIGGYVIAANFEMLIKGLFVFAHLFISLLIHISKFTFDTLIASNRLPAFRAKLTKQIHQTTSLLAHSHLFHFTSVTNSPLLATLESGSTTRPRARIESTWGLVKTHLHRTSLLWTLRSFNFASSPRLFYPTWIYLNYIIIGPWFIGNLVPSAHEMGRRVGLVYVYGVWFEDGWVPILDTWYLALWEHTTFVFPMVLILMWNAPVPAIFGHHVDSQYGRSHQHGTASLDGLMDG